jgi:hypothetical protein
MTLYKVTISDTQDFYFVEADTSDQAIDELKAELGLEQISGDVEEIVQ